MRVILYTGKGGVGKTSAAAATALRAAELGYKTIVLSTDIAHSLSDSYDVELGHDPTLITTNLWGQETDILETLRVKWGTIQRYMAALFAWRGIDEIVADEIAILPGMEELANLLYIIHYQDEGKYDVVIVDCAPTGETLRLLSFPEMLHWWMTRMFPIGKMVASMVHPLARALTNIPLPDKEVFDSIQDLYNELERIRALLTDPKISSVRLVMNPEKMVIKEAQRTFTYLSLYGYATDLVVCNRLIPETVAEDYFHAWKEHQKHYLQMIHDSFAPLPIAPVPLLQEEIVGLPMLRKMGQALFRDQDPTGVFYEGHVQDIQKGEGYYILTLTLPFSSKEKIELSRNADELVIRVAHFRRNIVLPHILMGLPVTEAKLEGDKLRLKFQRDAAKEAAERRRK
ncbi:MAG: ArsA family ATPase [Chloroflexi bacterium]|nr:ArsA family ATPase [Chloroflexota bacterium]